MEQSNNQALQQDRDFNYAQNSLKKMGVLKSITKANGLYRVEIEIDGELYFEECDDMKIATIRLNNQFN